MKTRPVLYLAACAALPLALLTYGIVGGTGMATQGRLLVREVQREEALDQRTEAAGRCMRGKLRIVAEVLAGRMSLRDAADGFGELNTLLDDGNDDVLGAYPRAASEEELCRNVIAWVRAEVRRNPAAPAGVLGRLERECEELFGRTSPPLVP
jgi:hypothetical protein